ncbi:CAAD domain-containing protein [Synechococcus sp. UW179A]|uniref:CAAD domain-containing protein n=1 Tax=Synechococcus sp. UW179A TaxID=2575510 RepID=UPI000E0F9D7D|nr:CAAD domain-containing protein [Synechococcus sp. UW179A]
MSSDKPSENQAPAESINPDLPAQGDITDGGVETDKTAEAAKSEAAPATAASAPPQTTVTTEPVAQPVAPSASTSIAERISIPAQAPADDSGEEGGEWDLLSNRIKQFFEANNLQDQWQSLRQPLFLLGGLIVVILTMRIYGGILDAIATVPLAPRLFQLVGTFYAIWFAATRLIRAEERKKISANVNDLWSSLRGGSKS